MTSALFAPSLVGLGAAELAASYSADRIADSGTVKAPVSFGGYAWVCVSVSSVRAVGYMLVEPRDFTGSTWTYNEKTSIQREGDKYPGDFARGDPNGFYHGMTVKSGNCKMVLCGPAQTIEGDAWDRDRADEADEDEDEQLEPSCCDCGVVLAQLDEFHECDEDGGERCPECFAAHALICRECGADAPHAVDEDEDEPMLPTFEAVPSERAEASAVATGERLTGELLTPRPSISGRTGRMEAHSPLFANSEANPQLSLFGGQQ